MSPVLRKQIRNIVLAGLAPTVENSGANMSDWLYLRRLYEVGAGRY